MNTTTLLAEYEKESYEAHTMIDYDDLNKYPNLVIIGFGEENLHFIHESKNYSCKCL